MFMNFAKSSANRFAMCYLFYDNRKATFNHFDDINQYE